MNNTTKRTRLAAIIACLVVMFCIGLVYTWSVFQQPVTDHYGWDASMVSMISSAMLISGFTRISSSMGLASFLVLSPFSCRHACAFQTS